LRGPKSQMFGVSINIFDYNNKSTMLHEAIKWPTSYFFGRVGFYSAGRNIIIRVHPKGSVFNICRVYCQEKCICVLIAWYHGSCELTLKYIWPVMTWTLWKKIYYSETSLTRTLGKPKTCLNRTQSKPKTCLSRQTL
jgi:hypothetical protein